MKLCELYADEVDVAHRGPMSSPAEETSREKREASNDVRDKVLMVDRGENHKKAKRIASNARTNAKATNKEKDPPKEQEVIQGADDTPHTSQGNVQHDWRGGR